MQKVNTLGFKIVCENCKSTDVSVSNIINIYDHVEIVFICNSCGLVEEQPY